MEDDIGHTGWPEVITAVYLPACRGSPWHDAGMSPTATLPITAAAVSLTLAASLLATEPATATTKLKPPLVTEDFGKPPKCNPNTTIGQAGCGERKVLADDKVMNADITVVFKLLSSRRAQQDFMTAQDDWVRYRKADCVSQSDVYLGGTEQGVIYVYCLAAQDQARRADLKTLYKDFSQGLSHPPKFP